MKKSTSLLLLVLAIAATYAPVARNGFVWDDTALILRDPFIRSWRLIAEGFQHFLFTDATASDFYRPIQRLIYTIEYATFEFAPAAYHVTSVACHIAAALALYFFSTELLRAFAVAEKTRRWAPLLSTAAWALHPLHTSAVAYISGRADPLAATFGFTGLYLALRGWRSPKPQQILLTAGSALAFLFSTLSKEAGLIFLAIWLALIAVRRTWRELAAAAVVVGFVLVSYASLRFAAEHVPPPSSATTSPLVMRPILVARAVAEYAGLIVLPVNLHMDRDVETHPSGFGSESLTSSAWRELQTLAGILLLAAFIFWLLRERKRDRAVFACLLLTLLTYLPVSGIFRLNATVAEHWLYLPSAFLLFGITLAAARVLDTLPRRMRTVRMLVTSVAAVWVLFLAGRTFVRTFDWRDQRTFLERTVARGGHSVRMLINLGALEMSEGRFDLARKHLHAALARDPTQPMAVINRAALALKENDFKAAHEILARATQMPAIEAQAHELLAILESKESGRANLLRMRLATRTGAPNWAIEKRYIALLHSTGATDAAIAELKHCLATQWYRAESWQLLAELLTSVGRTEEAADAAAQARRYDVRLAAAQPGT